MDSAQSLASSLAPQYMKYSGTGRTYFSFLDFVSTPDFTVVQTGEKDLLFGSSGFDVSGTATVYIGASIDTIESRVQIPMPECTLKELRVLTSVAPGAGTLVYTVRKNGVDTSMTATISGSGFSSTHVTDVAFAAGDKFSLELEANGAQLAVHSYSIEIQLS